MLDKTAILNFLFTSKQNMLLCNNDSLWYNYIKKNYDPNNYKILEWRLGDFYGYNINSWYLFFKILYDSRFVAVKTYIVVDYFDSEEFYSKEFLIIRNSDTIETIFNLLNRMINLWISRHEWYAFQLNNDDISHKNSRSCIIMTCNKNKQYELSIGNDPIPLLLDHKLSDICENWKIGNNFSADLYFEF
jgi:hypothetical protein